jgi:hypothetical protein
MAKGKMTDVETLFKAVEGAPQDLLRELLDEDIAKAGTGAL